MSSLCFCGCRCRVRFSRRSSNTLGRKVSDALTELDRLGLDRANDAFAALLHEGHQLRRFLQAITHGEANTRRTDDEVTLRWLRFVWAISAETPGPPKPGPEPGPPPAPQPDPAPPVPRPEPGPPGSPAPGPELLDRAA